MARLDDFGGGVPPEFELMLEDLLEVNLVLVGKRKHGKTTSFATFLQFVKEYLGDKIIIKVFDVSQAWYHFAPVVWRQYVAPGVEVVNIGDCVFEMDDLSKDGRREFVGRVVSADYAERRAIKRVGGKAAIEMLPLILYVFEEANTYFDSQSLNRKNDYSTVLTDLISVGRNYGFGGALIVTRMVGELAPGIRERCNLLLGRVSGAGELRSLGQAASKEVREIVKSIDKFHWMYWNGSAFGPFRIRDLVRSVPVDYVAPVREGLEMREVLDGRPHVWGFWDTLFMGLAVLGVAAWILFAALGKL